MARSNQATQAKRQRERSRVERNQEKQEKRALRSDQKKDRDQSMQDGIDPDLIGIVPGPQPIPEDN
jgi:hypothetical protein